MDFTSYTGGARLDFDFDTPPPSPSTTTYLMRGYDTDGAQYVYWQADDPADPPTTTVPAAVGTVSAICVFQVLTAAA